jgi:hypothetical protein
VCVGSTLVNAVLIPDTAVGVARVCDVSDLVRCTRTVRACAWCTLSHEHVRGGAALELLAVSGNGPRRARERSSRCGLAAAGSVEPGSPRSLASGSGTTVLDRSPGPGSRSKPRSLARIAAGDRPGCPEAEEGFEATEIAEDTGIEEVVTIETAPIKIACACASRLGFASRSGQGWRRSQLRGYSPYG